MFTRRMIETERGAFEIFKRGQGEPLAFTHLYSEFNENGDIMSQQLSEFYTVYVINLRGAGNSADATDQYTYSMDDAIHDMEAVRTALNIDVWTFAGHSTGGFLALKYAVMYPERLTQVIGGGLCASYEYMNDPDSLYCKENSNNAHILKIFSELDAPEVPREKSIELTKEWIMMSLYRKGAYEEMLKRKNSGRTLVKKLDYFTSELKNYDVRENLKQTPVRAYIYCGRHDVQCPYVFSQEAAELMPNSTLTTFEHSNHMPFIEEEEKFIAFLKTTI